ncbi:protein Star [Cherax quadricarinatus]
MLRIKGIFYVGAAFLLIFIMVVFTSESFSLNSLLRPVPHSPRISKVNTQEFNSGDVAADSPEVIQVIREQFLIPPSNLPYNLSEPYEENPSMGQAQRIDFILKGKRNGFYIECGALDGEVRSNTLFFERKRGWNGLLIEADPKNFNQMVEKHRKAYMSPSCLAPTPHPTTVLFQQQENQGHILGRQQHYPSSGSGEILEVQCFPLFSYLVALNVTTVDYFSLDVEGAEFSVLKTIPWDKVDIKTLSVEFIHDPEGKDAIQEYMKRVGYYVHSEVRHYNWLANDFIFVKNSMQ